MTSDTSAAAVERGLYNALDALKRGDTSAWVDMFHDDGVMEFPYAPPGNPERLDGKPAIAAYMTHYPEHIAIHAWSKRDAYRAGDVLVVEFSVDGVAVPTGNAFTMAYVGIVRHEDGRVRHYRDYWNPLVAQQAMGRSAGLVDGTDGETA